MKHVIVVREVKEIYHQIVADITDDSQLDEISDRINMGDFGDIEEIADYVDEIAPVYSVDNCYDELVKEFWCDEAYEADI